MKRRGIFRTLLLVCLAAVIAALVCLRLAVPDLFRGGEHTARAVAFFPRLTTPTPEVVFQRTEGVVVGVTRTTVAIKTQGKPVEDYVFTPELIAGRLDRTWPYDVPEPTAFKTGSGYLPSDVRVGDWVRLWHSRVKGVDICDAIVITRRPGGKVPPPPGYDPSTGPGYHDKQNTYWEQAEARAKGVSHGPPEQSPMPPKP